MNRSSKSKLKELLCTYREELLLFFILALCFGALTAHALQSGVLSPVESEVGAYLGYDNYSRFQDRGGVLDLSHPFINPFYIFNRFIAVRLLGESGALCLAVWLMCLFVVSSLTAVYFYLRRITQLALHRSLILLLLLASSFTVLTLAFTIESYPPSLFILTLSVVVLSYGYQHRGYFSKRAIWIFSFLAGGITLSNVAKPALVLHFSKDPFKKRVQSLVRLAAAFTIATVLVALAFTWRANSVGTPDHAPLPILKGALTQYRTPAQHWMSEYFGQAYLVGDLELREANGELTLRPKAYADFYWHLPQYFLAILVLAAILYNRRNRLPWLLVTYLGVDIFVNIICRYGMDEAIIFGAHWVFLIPLILAWLYRGLKRSYAYGLDLLLLALALWQLSSNLPLILHQLLVPQL